MSFVIWTQVLKSLIFKKKKKSSWKFKFYSNVLIHWIETETDCTISLSSHPLNEPCVKLMTLTFHISINRNVLALWAAKSSGNIQSSHLTLILITQIMCINKTWIRWLLWCCGSSKLYCKSRHLFYKNVRLKIKISFISFKIWIYVKIVSEKKNS